MTNKAPVLKIIVVGQTPPPLHGQALMIKLMLEGVYSGVELIHVRMGFSSDISQVGHFSFMKVFRLIALLFRIMYVRRSSRADALFYPPAGPHAVPILRDLVVLLSTRWMFRFLILRFHAGGVSTYRSSLFAPLRILFDAAYRGADLAIAANEETTADPRALGAKRIAIVPHGIPDTAGGYIDRTERLPTNLLFVGNLIESKGVLVLIEAVALLRSRGFPIRSTFVGAWTSEAFHEKVSHFVADRGLTESIEFTGLLYGDEKWRRFREADLFSMPSFYESETSGAVFIEAMAFSLPVVTTFWRGIPSVVSDGETAILVPTMDPVATADALQRLLDSPHLRAKFAKAGRARFEANFSVQKHLAGLNRAFLSLLEPPKSEEHS